MEVMAAGTAVRWPCRLSACQSCLHVQYLSHPHPRWLCLEQSQMGVPFCTGWVPRCPSAGHTGRGHRVGCRQQVTRASSLGLGETPQQHHPLETQPRRIASRTRPSKAAGPQPVGQAGPRSQSLRWQDCPRQPRPHHPQQGATGTQGPCSRSARIGPGPALTHPRPSTFVGLPEERQSVSDGGAPLPGAAHPALCPPPGHARSAAGDRGLHHDQRGPQVEQAQVRAAGMEQDGRERQHSASGICLARGQPRLDLWQHSCGSCPPKMEQGMGGAVGVGQDR